MGEELNAEIFARLTKKIGPAAVAFTQYVSTELWRRARQTALAQGFTIAEAEQIARGTAAGAVKGMVSEIGFAQKMRGFRLKD